MRSIDFKDKESLEKMIELLEHDSIKLKIKLDESFNNDKFLDFCYWNMDELMLIKSAIKVLGRVLQRANSNESEFRNTFKEFILFNLVNIDYLKQDNIQRFQSQIWKEIYDISEYIKIK